VYFFIIKASAGIRCLFIIMEMGLAGNGEWRMGMGDWGLKVLKFDGAIAPRVLKFDSGYAAEGCGERHMDKPL